MVDFNAIDTPTQHTRGPGDICTSCGIEGTWLIFPQAAIHTQCPPRLLDTAVMHAVPGITAHFNTSLDSAPIDFDVVRTLNQQHGDFRRHSD